MPGIGLGLGLGLGVANQRASSPPPPPPPPPPPSFGPELWPQPTFTSAAGLTLDGGGDDAPTVSGGLLTFPDEGDPAICSAAALDTLVAGEYRYEITLTANPVNAVLITLNDGTVNSESFVGTGTFTGTITLPNVATQNIWLTTSYNAAEVSRFSLKRML